MNSSVRGKSNEGVSNVTVSSEALLFKGLLRKGVTKEYVATPILIAVLVGCPNQYKIVRKQRQLYGVLTGSFLTLMLDCWIHILAWESQSVGHDLEN